jgi:hypothetical protein
MFYECEKRRLTVSFFSVFFQNPNYSNPKGVGSYLYNNRDTT